MRPLKYIWDHLLMLAAATVCYQSIFFAAVPGLTVWQSKIALWTSALVLAALGCLLTLRRRRNDLSLFVNLLLPYELYTIAAYRDDLPRLVWGSVLFSGLLALAFLALSMLPDAERDDGWWKRQLRHGLLGARTIAAVCLLTLMLPLGGRLIFSPGLMDTDTPPADGAAEAQEWTVKNKLDTVRLLREEDWAELSPQEKLDVLGAVLNIEIRYLGLNHELYLQSGILDDGSLAYYNHKDYLVMIDLDHLKTSPAAEVLRSLCHECYHSYQRQVVALYESTPEEYREMLLFQYADRYMQEFSRYQSGKDDILGYYYQTIEVHARHYAASAVEEYYDRIEECLQEAAQASGSGAA